jgi:acetyl-CoA carboxylase carboxyltransferase component
MAKVILHPIGSPVEDATDEKAYADNCRRMEELNQLVIERREEVRAGWGDEYVQRVHAKGKLSTWERLEILKDEGTTIFPLNTFVNYGLEFGKPPRTSPAAGVITAFVRVHGRLTVVIANDNTVASGSWWPMTPEKIERAQEVGLRLRVPVIYLVDCSGLYLPEQSKTFPGRTGAGYIFKMNSLLSAHGVPQIAGVLGDCIAGGGYMPIISDKLFMTEQAYMVIAGAALVKGGKSQKITSLSIGGPDVHVHLSNCADERVPDDQTMIQRIRQEVETLPASAATYYRHGFAPAEPRFAPRELNGLLPVDHRVVYDAHEIIARLVDDSLFWELAPHTGEEMVTGIARINGLYVGIIANNQKLTPHPELKDRTRAGGLLYREGIAKISQFSRSCNSDGIPIIWLQDISGFDIGVEAEKHGLLAYGSNLLYTNSTNTVPMITVLLRKASGAGYYAMTGLPYEPFIQISTPLTRLAVMEGRTLAIGAFRTKLDDNFHITSEDPQERAKVEAGMKSVEDRISADMDPYKSARQMDTDEIVPVAELRDYLMTLVEMCYQSFGYRRVKNPRIWSMHDLNVLTDFAG